MELHPLCTLFPRMSSSEFTTLRDDIAANGLLTPITTYEGMILDGGNRYRACLEAGVEPRYEEYAGDDLVQFVLSSNLNRRHLMPGQMAVIVASAQDWSKAQSQGGDRKSDQVATLPLDSIATRATLSGASERTQRDADRVARENPELAKKVIAGEVTLPKALEQVTGKVRVRNDTASTKTNPPTPQETNDRPYNPDVPTAASIATQQARAAICMIPANDPNAMQCIEIVQKALNNRRILVQERSNKNGHSH